MSPNDGGHGHADVKVESVRTETRSCAGFILKMCGSLGGSEKGWYGQRWDVDTASSLMIL